jgi:hypothetical protein
MNERTVPSATDTRMNSETEARPVLGNLSRRIGTAALIAGLSWAGASAALGQNRPDEKAQTKDDEVTYVNSIDSAEHGRGQANDEPDKDKGPKPKRERVKPAKPQKTEVNERSQHQVIVIKFLEGSRIRQRDGKLVAESHKRSDEDKQRLQRSKLSDAAIDKQLGRVHDLLKKHPTHRLERLFSRAEAELDNDKTEGDKHSDEELADLNLYFRVYLHGVSAAESAALMDQLNELDVIEIAYPEPVSEDAAVDFWPATPSYTSSQWYLGAAPSGIDANYTRGFSGARGEGVRVIDVEQNWNFGHEDLNSVFAWSGEFLNGRDHGTAVLGVIGAAENAYGMTGITPRAALGVSAVNRTIYLPFAAITFYDFADAVNRASSQLASGDIMLLEQHARGPASGLACTCNCGQFEYVAMEYWQANYDAIRNATARGVIVVEAAGNGSMNLDSGIYGGLFNRSVRDSGAILVGAGTAFNRVPECWSNFGSRVDVQGWGDSVATLGYGDLAMVNGSDDRQWYTGSFSGTSSATPIVTGAAASIQGMRKARGMVTLNSYQMRRLLSQTGTAQASSSKSIGPLPDLHSAFDSHGSYAYLYPNTYYNWISGIVAPQGYRDYWVYSSGGRYYEFSTCYYADFDTVIDVYNPYGTLIATSDDACGLKSQVTPWMGTGGWYRVRVRGYGAYSSGFYWMSYRML